jgi:hypothetical protein
MAYKINVNVQIEETDDTPDTEGPIQLERGSFGMNISSSVASSIDQCEKALLEVSSVTLRDALSSHLSQISKKEADHNQPGFVKKTI